MLRQEEFLQEFVHLEQPYAVNHEAVAAHRHEAPVLEPLDRFGDTDQGLLYGPYHPRYGKE